MSNNKEGGIGLLGVLFIVFLVLKLVGVITWSWWWVTTPIWGPIALGLVIMGFFLLIGGVIHALS